MLSSIKNYRAEHARRKMLSQEMKKSKFRKWRFLAVSTVVITLSILVYSICFIGRPPVVPHIVSKNKSAQVQIVSPFDFTYISEIQTQANRDRNAERIAPQYKINESAIANGAENIKKIVSIFDNNQQKYSELPSENKNNNPFFEDISTEIRKATLIDVSPEDAEIIYEKTDNANRNRAFNQVFFHAGNILRDGVYPDGDSVFSSMTTSSSPNVDISGGFSGGIGALHLRAISETDARRELLEKVKNLGMNDVLAKALYRIVKETLVPNTEFDEEKTKALRDEAREKVKDVVVKIRRGETLVDSETAPSPIVSEKIKAYKVELEKRNQSYGFTSSTIEYLFSLLVVISGTFFIAISRQQKNRQPRTIAIFCTLLIINLILERGFIEFSSTEYFDTNTPLLQILAYVAPIMLGPMIMVLIFGSYTGFIMAIMVSALTTLMLGEGIVYFIIFLACTLIAIFFTGSATSRPRVIIGGLIYGLCISLISLIMGYCNELPMAIVWRQSLLAIGSGVMTSFVAIGVLPLFELIFNRYSNITLLDYTDFNNPLLRKMQIEAPGTYHHSVMVSYLAEAAAVAVGANPMVCRVGALFHDIGKIQKPEFFTENQQDGKNAHDDQNPSMSALIIKNHIREGVEIAKLAKLPRQVIEAIEQHHGTSVIMYFYNKAMKMAESAGDKRDPIQALRDAGIEESTYRHEGTKPQTVENAIIMIADSCEAASRSLKRITKHGIEDLVNAIVRGKMNDGQLDECPITVKQISKLKESIAFTMLNMLHSRVSYNNENEKK